MFLRLSLLIIYAAIVSLTEGYLAERYPPFIVTSPASGQVFKHGDSIQVTWELVPGTRFPLYGYAAARTAKTVGGLLKSDASKTGSYVKEIDTHLSFLDFSYTWTVDNKTQPGVYRFGIGFFYHEASPTFHITD
ncbi:uncharacterized protein BYT42DRAFT_612025 [Radiomyces spectabilis]|uniref:uncharacterized protein n=1 Tax=Radiomyces spectabilis TaxID=64574 RepID=UPI0022203697|nr:uncharacterized protein BYT42DRAFT_612025 [Radiomyces spectabilis]KAI8384313.1 hypothetical protein BYT42DRAFT_612025 [Radiomyces spectabilis]